MIIGKIVMIFDINKDNNAILKITKKNKLFFKKIPRKLFE